MFYFIDIQLSCHLHRQVSFSLRVPRSRYLIAFSIPQIHRCDAANKVRQAQKQPPRLPYDTAGVGHIGRYRLADSPGPQQHAQPRAGRVRLLQRRLYPVLLAEQLLYTLHHHGVSVLEHIQGEFDNRLIVIIIYIDIRSIDTKRNNCNWIFS